MTLSYPVLARCDDRSILAKAGSMGSPDDWLSRGLLATHSLFPVGFDFFIPWNSNPLFVQSEVWLKRITSHMVPATLSGQQVQNYEADLSTLGDNLNQLGLFSSTHGFDVRCFVFRDNVSWSDSAELIAELKLSGGSVVDARVVDLSNVASRIQKLSGGPVSISSGLTYGTSSLECHLAGDKQLRAAWPGDADMVICNGTSGKASHLLEFKKHNLPTPIEDEGYGKYPDFRRFERLALLRDHLGLEAFIFLVYPTGSQGKIKLQWIGGHHKNLKVLRSEIIGISGMSSGQIGDAILAVI